MAVQNSDINLRYCLSLWYFKASSSPFDLMKFHYHVFICVFFFISFEYFESEVSNLYFYKVPVTISSSISFPLCIFPSGISTVWI